ncbi:sulfite exporter TauE/SafE family protein [Shewanella eurypsychrophilus]|uniref:Probable membrane transporter protein n=1 Tax=Shewanella eurypsychrophilus TaxID=2593656 RepID=A0ABX6V2X4_9GAMM|nr:MULTISPECIES: sulfite exporter TauE/SafE family protein [Shewanella]QFU21689.1 TSUP family transporter [Shewanella sp. YLB-09]QPG56979.1 sulfite exporter TauE/SafE family protein [Shewanella eurypsychrophilus]
MDSLLLIFLVCLGLGAVIGFMAGLLGIGGGIIAVPVLLYLLPKAGFGSEILPHVAIATSLAAIILTSLSSARAHNRQGNIPWSLLKPMLPGLAIGSICSGFISQLFSADLLQQTFAIFVMVMALQMVFPFKVSERDKPLPSTAVLFTTSVVIAIIAALMGIGGGILLIPFLTWCGIHMRNAIGFSSVSGLFIAFFGSAGYVVAGWQVTGMPEATLGYVYLPALLGIVTTSVLMAPIGARAATYWPVPVLRRAFALLLILTGLKLVFS